ncbi:unnamed protein product [Schistosoma curassoni]|uniref:Uncharacterized protein n=1 Tax=Schistosoma curassoni TaxID=6186 RepID=A0A183L6L1_9TREM|nr:unnamed protein product [Schistosoma curassoni]
MMLPRCRGPHNPVDHQKKEEGRELTALSDYGPYLECTCQMSSMHDFAL